MHKALGSSILGWGTLNLRDWGGGISESLVWHEVSISFVLGIELLSSLGIGGSIMHVLLLKGHHGWLHVFGSIDESINVPVFGLDLSERSMVSMWHTKRSIESDCISSNKKENGETCLHYVIIIIVIIF